MHLKKVTTKYKGETREYAQIVQSVRGEDGQTTQEVIKSPGRMENEEDWERARSILKAMEKGEKLVKLKELEIERQLELGGIWAADEIWRKDKIQKALTNSFTEKKNRIQLGKSHLSSDSQPTLQTIKRFVSPRVDQRESLHPNESEKTVDLQVIRHVGRGEKQD